MQVLLILAGVGLLLLTVTDALITTIAPGSGGGPITNGLSRWVWRVLRLLSPRKSSRLLHTSGPLAIVAVVAAWLCGLWLGWFLIFSASPEAVVAADDGTPADAVTRLYYVGYTVFTLGIGDQVPAGSPWRVATVLATISGLVFTTLAITYILPVVTAVTERRQQASRIAALGGDAQSIVINGWDGAGFQIFEQILPQLAADLTLTAERQLTYPVLGHFHAGAPTEDHRVQMVALDEAVTLLKHAVDHERAHVHPLMLHLIRHATEQHIDRAELPQADGDEARPPTPDLEPLRAAGIPTVDDDTFDRAVAEDEEHRRHLVVLASETPRDWSGAVRTRPAGDEPDD